MWRVTGEQSWKMWTVKRKDSLTGREKGARDQKLGGGGGRKIGRRLG